MKSDNCSYTDTLFHYVTISNKNGSASSQTIWMRAISIPYSLRPSVRLSVCHLKCISFSAAFCVKPMPYGSEASQSEIKWGLNLYEFEIFKDICTAQKDKLCRGVVRTSLYGRKGKHNDVCKRRCEKDVVRKTFWERRCVKDVVKKTYWESSFK